MPVPCRLKCKKAGKISITSVDGAGPAAAPVNAASPPPSVADPAPTSADTGLTVTGNSPAQSASVSAPGALPHPNATNTVPSSASSDGTVDTSEATLEDNADLVEQEPTDVDVIVPTAPLSVVPDTGVLLTATNRFGTTWEAAPVCLGKPSKRTAVQVSLLSAGSHACTEHVLLQLACDKQTIPVGGTETVPLPPAAAVGAAAVTRLCCIVAVCRTHLADCGGRRGASPVPTVMLKVAPCTTLAMCR